MEKVDRRKFIATAAAGTFAVPSLLKSTVQAESKKLKMGLIGCGWYGMVDVDAAFKVGGVEIIAVCDVDSKHLNDTADKIKQKQGTRPKTFKHHKELLDTPGLEAVIIATPPQWHALQFIDALNKNLDIYCEKPLAYDIREGQAMAAAAQKSDRIVQIGFQRRQSLAIGQARDFIRSGGIGKVIQAEVQIHYTAGILDTAAQDPPETLDWNLWCGPAPKLPYCPQIGHKAWRLEKEYGHGHLVDWGIHLIDATRWILGETTPKWVDASGGIYHYKGKITTPDTLTAHFEFETCPVVWRHRLWGAVEYDSQVSNGIFLYGEKGTVFATDRRWIFIPKGKDKERKEVKVGADMGKEQMAEFLQSVKTRKQPGCTTADGNDTTTTVKLAMIALDTGSRVHWDRRSGQIVDNPKAQKLLKRDYRSPWMHPWKG